MPSRYDTLTLVAMAVLVYSLSSFIHEGLGHGGACLLAGGHPVEISSVHFDCDSAHPRIVSSGGTIMNLVTGALCWIALWLLRASRHIHFRYFLWLLMTVNLLQGGGYFLYSGVGNIGDWSDVIARLEPQLAWRIGLTLLGTAAYAAFIWVALRAALQFLPVSGDPRWKSAKKVMLVPYIAGGTLSCLTGMLNPVGMALVAISAAAASLGGTSGLAWMWQLLRGDSFRTGRAAEAQEPGLPRSLPWIIAAGIAAVAFVAMLGPGIKFRAG